MYLMNILKSASSKVFCHTEEIQESFLNMPSEETAKMKHMASESFEKYDIDNIGQRIPPVALQRIPVVSLKGYRS